MISDQYNHMFIHDSLPVGWEVTTASDVISKISTGLNPRHNFALGSGNIKYVTVKNLTSTGSIDFSNCDTIDESAREKVHRRSDISPGDILFASIAPLGRCFLIQEYPSDWDINESVFSIRPSGAIPSEYLYSYFMSEPFISKAQLSSTGSIFKGIRINTLLEMTIVIPPRDLLNQFSQKTRPLFKKRQLVFKENLKLKSLRDWLLPLLMSGQATIDD